MLLRVDMIVFYVHDWTAMLGWYQAKLGFTAAYVEDEHRFAVLGLSGGGPMLHLVGDESRSAGQRNRCVPNIAVDDFDRSLAELRERGVSIVEVIDDDEDGYRLARLADPEGNELNLYAVVQRT
jgi:catechol 2,3-dioxygenase-like lactoylglutathione lyase family enzyme